ncbi:MAG: hypothetical protein ABI396_05520, partial [Ktedonobacteraceae bacterium]
KRRPDIVAATLAVALETTVHGVSECLWDYSRGFLNLLGSYSNMANIIMKRNGIMRWGERYYAHNTVR